jgi:hypothetical protein
MLPIFPVHGLYNPSPNRIHMDIINLSFKKFPGSNFFLMIPFFPKPDLSFLLQ